MPTWAKTRVVLYESCLMFKMGWIIFGLLRKKEISLMLVYSDVLIINELEFAFVQAEKSLKGGRWMIKQLPKFGGVMLFLTKWGKYDEAICYRLTTIHYPWGIKRVAASHHISTATEKLLSITSQLLCLLWNDKIVPLEDSCLMV